MATKLKGQGAVTADLVLGVIAFGILIAVGIFVLVAATEAVPQDHTYTNETLLAGSAHAMRWCPPNWTYPLSPDNPPFYTAAADIELFNGTGGQLLVASASYIVNSSNSIYVYCNATGNTTNAIMITYTHNQWAQSAAKEAQGSIDQTNTNWNNGIQLLAVALIVIAAGAILYTTRTGMGGG